VLSEGYTYDFRQTDHAWVETRALLFFDAEGTLPDLLTPGAGFEEVKWQPLDAATINRVPSGQAVYLRAAVQSLGDSGRLASATAESLLASTG
jgi:hypothetical protein